jgi:hypothetical protein
MEFHLSATQKKDYRQNAKAVAEWLEETYPAIVEKAVTENAEIWWLDEVGVRNSSNYIKGYSPRGVTPTVPVASVHIGVNMISSITNKGKLRYHFYQGKFNQDVFMRFLKRIISTADKKVFAIVDNSSVHHGLLLRAWKEKHKESITIFYLPSYVPHLNPVEYLNNNLKREMLKKGCSVNKNEVEKKAVSTMRAIQSKKNRVEAFFEHDDVKYAKN